MIESSQIVSAVRTLERYRRRIILILFGFAALGTVIYFKCDIVMNFLVSPLKGVELFFITPVEGVLARVKIAFSTAFLVTFPVLLYIVTSLMSGILDKKARRLIYYLVIPCCTIFFIGGLVFGYSLILPTTVNFLMSCAADLMTPLISADSYFTFVIYFLLSMGIVFEFPIILVALARVGVVNSKVLRVKRKIAILLIVAVLAVVTPTPDAFTLIAVSLPMIILYEISIWWVWMMERIKRADS